ncbi:hypothetical protein [Marinigracilibium pacificum]|uniref:Uncharacterized protein n=1 Tax=Marinigracilibium pacificum TaxID=2729599 RepID=A0A848J682_9BACT|nr:hypothetical protein [Marinigracilibium pacificum]NMM50748.1 hypothetical protein [Marinigracilibium pacificum]
MAECIECGAFSKFEGGLCIDCFKKSKKKNNNVEVIEDNENGLSEKDKTYRYSMIKGRIAETLIQELFLSLKYNVFSYGMENTIPGIMELLKGVRSDVATEIRRMPDFVIQNPNTKQVYFVEVKFRASGEFKFKDLPKNYPYQNAFIILVSKKHIKCISVEELNNGEEITPTSKNYLGSRKEFELDKDVIIEFCRFAVQFFEGV